MGHRAFYISALSFVIFSGVNVPWVTDVFLACSRNFWCWLKAEATSGEATRKNFSCGSL